MSFNFAKNNNYNWMLSMKALHNLVIWSLLEKKCNNKMCNLYILTLWPLWIYMMYTWQPTIINGKKLNKLPNLLLGLYGGQFTMNIRRLILIHSLQKKLWRIAYLRPFNNWKQGIQMKRNLKLQFCNVMTC